jgi:medium-chain acyl-[acyl-carrier-protein] hydrolase
VQLPGREDRWREAPSTSLPALVNQVFHALRPVLERGPYALFGHSMGALIAFELTRLMRVAGRRLPAVLFVSGARAPHLPDPEPPIRHLPDPVFLARLNRLEGFPSEILHHRELMQVVLLTLRPDITLCETYRHRLEPALPVPIVAFGGREDASIRHQELVGWRLHTAASFSLNVLPGKHFFLQGARSQIQHAITTHLEQIGGSPPRGVQPAAPAAVNPQAARLD